MQLWKTILNVDYRFHLIFSFLIRLSLIAYGIYHDEFSNVKYTDVDYKVFTDASRHIVNGGSPYDRHTYRYSPVVAIALVPNIVLHHSFGKVLFSFVDIIVALLIRTIVRNALKEFECYKQTFHKKSKVHKNVEMKSNRKKFRQSNRQNLNLTKDELESKNAFDLTADTAMLSWLYNPLTIAIGTRGNCDSLAGSFVLLTLYFLQCKHFSFIAGLLHGFSIHLRLYPIIYSLTMFMYLSKKSFYSIEDRRQKKQVQSIVDCANPKQLKNVENTILQSSSVGGHKIVPSNEIPERKTIFKMEYLSYLIPNLDQLKLMVGCCLSFSCFTWIFYCMYGDKFIYETYIYHFIRKDFRHNFSLYFYLQYLTAWVKNIGLWQKVLMLLPQLVLISVFSVRYGLNRISLNFSILTQTIVMVIYNTVLTSQYFVWIMAILPLCMWQIKMKAKVVVLLLAIWFMAQGVWLLQAYMLEFRGENTFIYIWIQSVSFFCANIAILGRLIKYFMPATEKCE